MNVLLITRETDIGTEDVHSLLMWLCLSCRKCCRYLDKMRSIMCMCVCTKIHTYICSYIHTYINTDRAIVRPGLGSISWDPWPLAHKGKTY